MVLNRKQQNIMKIKSLHDTCVFIPNQTSLYSLNIVSVCQRFLHYSFLVSYLFVDYFQGKQINSEAEVSVCKPSNTKKLLF